MCKWCHVDCSFRYSSSRANFTANIMWNESEIGRKAQGWKTTQISIMCPKSKTGRSEKKLKPTRKWGHTRSSLRARLVLWHRRHATNDGLSCPTAVLSCPVLQTTPEEISERGTVPRFSMPDFEMRWVILFVVPAVEQMLMVLWRSCDDVAVLIWWCCRADFVKVG